MGTAHLLPEEALYLGAAFAHISAYNAEARRARVAQQQRAFQRQIAGRGR